MALPPIWPQLNNPLSPCLGPMLWRVPPAEPGQTEAAPVLLRYASKLLSYYYYDFFFSLLFFSYSTLTTTEVSTQTLPCHPPSDRARPQVILKFPIEKVVMFVYTAIFIGK